jgi:hypothetical protein
VLLASKELAGDDAEWLELIARCGGNRLALEVVGESISQVFGGDIGLFLTEAGASGVLDGIRRLLSDRIEAQLGIVSAVRPRYRPRRGAVRPLLSGVVQVLRAEPSFAQAWRFSDRVDLQVETRRWDHRDR